jgi:hypothetical protein
MNRVLSAIVAAAFAATAGVAAAQGSAAAPS